MNTLVICGSHLYVPTLLSYILNSNDSIFICSDRKTVCTIFEKSNLSTISDVYYDEKVTGHRYNPLFYLRIAEYKKKLLHYYRDKKINKIIFFHEGYCETQNWLMLKLSKGVKIFYCPVARSYDVISHRVRYTFRNAYEILYSRIIWGYWIRPLRIQSSKETPFLTKSFFRRINAEIIEIEILPKLIYENLYKIIPSIPNIHNRILLLQCDVVNYTFAEDIYIAFVNEFLATIGVENVLFKAHPDFEHRYGDETKCESIPSYISANIIINNFPLVVGANSTVLAEAAKSGIPAISYLNIIPAIDSEQRDMQIKYLEDSGGGVLMPSSKDEFYNIVLSFLKNDLKNTF